MPYDEQPHALDRTRAKDGTLLYIGKAPAPLRHAEEYRGSNDWTPDQAVRIDLEWFPNLGGGPGDRGAGNQYRASVYHVQHNMGRIRIMASVSAEVDVGASRAAFLGLAACAVGRMVMAN